MNPWPFIGIMAAGAIASGAFAASRRDWPTVVGDSAVVLLALALGVLIARENRR